MLRGNGLIVSNSNQLCACTFHTRKTVAFFLSVFELLKSDNWLGMKSECRGFQLNFQCDWDFARFGETFF